MRQALKPEAQRGTASDRCYQASLQKVLEQAPAQAQSTATTATHPNEEPLESSENCCESGYRCLRSGSGTEQSTNGRGCRVKARGYKEAHVSSE
jgi:hypothetical protein